MVDIPDSAGEDRLGQLRVQLETVQRIAGLGSWEADVRTDELTWSPEVYRILGLSETVEPSYSRFLEIVHPDDRGRMARAHADAIEGRTVHSFEHRVVRPDGTIRHVQEEVVSEREDGEVVRLLGTMQDITDQMLRTRSLIDTESRRRELLHRLVRSSERERAKLAGDLHDGPIQMLIVASMRLEHLGKVETDTPAWLPDAVDTVRETVVQLRDVLVELHPHATAGAGLDAILTQLARTVVPDRDVSIEVRGAVDDAESRAVFGIVQEAVWDVRERHASRHLDISVDVGDHGLEVVLTGGHQPGSASDLLSRAGLLGVRERTEGVGGRCTVETDDDGSAVRCLLPHIAPKVAATRA